MEFGHNTRTERLRTQLRAFMAEQVIPREPEWHAGAEQGRFALELIEELKARAKEKNLWNLFLPTLRDDEPGLGLSNVEYAPLAEVMGRVPWSSEIFNCSPPDSVNVEILHRFASAEQRARYLEPLLDGAIRSAVAMSEPDVSSSDPANLRTTIERDGDELIVDGRKWFVNGVLHPRFTFVAVFGISAADADADGRYSFVIVPKDTPGFRIGRHVPVMGQSWPAGYCEVSFERARIPATNLIGEPGSGLAVTAVLTPAVLHHCMRSLGQCELSLELMAARALERGSVDRSLSDHASIRDWIAHSRIEVDQARLLTLAAAWAMDTATDSADADLAVSAAKVAVAQTETRVADRAMQVFGAQGLTADTPLSYFWTWGRAMRIIDGPDEVHLDAVAANEFEKAQSQVSAG